ncbi:MAG: type II toxin-antitoxin system PemK/MazF family toxin [Lachnospiraceae bacterium]|nr:type II toxin-antitoxin system PemK/MazF family toxin [Lachnospiraceae bacterium]
MREEINQGDILKVDCINRPVLVVSKDFFNQTGEIIACPVYEKGEPEALHIYVCADKTKGYVHCEKLALLDLNVRHYTKTDRIYMPDIINITDAIQGIFDYI